MKVKISKLDAAKRELEHSIRLFFNSADIVVIHLVCSSAHMILFDLSKLSKVQSFYEEFYKMIKPEKRKEIRDKLNEAYNFFKHAEKDSGKLLEFNPDSSEFIIFDSISMYQKLTNEITGLMMAFRLYFFLKYPEIMLNSEERDAFQDAQKKFDINKKNSFLEAADFLENKRVKS